MTSEHKYPQVPADPDTERVLLTTMLLGPENPEVPECMRLLNGGESFFIREHRAIYLAFKGLMERHEEISTITLKAECEAQGTLDKAGGYQGIWDVTSATEEVLHPLKLVQRNLDLYRRRQLQRVVAKAMQDTGDASIATEEILRALQEVMTEPGSGVLLTISGAGEFLDHDPPAPRWLIPGVIPAAVPVVMASKGGVGKSFLSLQACIALATGKPFLSCERQPPMGAVYFGLEDDRDTFHRRVRSIVNHYKDCQDWTPEDDQALRENFAAPFINWKAKGATAFLPTLAPELAKVLQTMTEHGVRPGVVIIDTLARVSEGDENTVQALRPVLNALNLILEYGWSPLVLHHVAKGQDGARGDAKKKPLLADRMSTEWVRGSSAIVDNFRCVLQLTLINPDEAAGAGLDEDKARMGGYAVFGATKLNGGQKSDWLFVEQDEHGRWFTPRDGIETLARIRGAKALTTLNKQTAILADLYEASRRGVQPDMAQLAMKHFDDPKFKDPKATLRQAIFKLRSAGFVQKGNYSVTTSGYERIQVTHGDQSEE